MPAIKAGLIIVTLCLVRMALPWWLYWLQRRSSRSGWQAELRAQALTAPTGNT